MVGESNKNNKKSGSEQIDLDTAATVIGWYVDWGQRWEDTVIDVHNRECWSWLTSSGHSLSSYTGDSDSAAPTMLSNKTISLSENIWYQQKNILLSSFKEKVLCKLNLLFHLKKGWNYIFFVATSQWKLTEECCAAPALEISTAILETETFSVELPAWILHWGTEYCIRSWCWGEQYRYWPSVTWWRRREWKPLTCEGEAS